MTKHKVQKRWHPHLDNREGGGVEEGPVSAQAHDEVDLVRQVVFALGERHQLVFDVRERRVLRQKRVIHHRRLHKHHHSHLVDEPLDQLNKRLRLK